MVNNAFIICYNAHYPAEKEIKLNIQQEINAIITFDKIKLMGNTMINVNEINNNNFTCLQ